MFVTGDQRRGQRACGRGCSEGDETPPPTHTGSRAHQEPGPAGGGHDGSVWPPVAKPGHTPARSFFSPLVATLHSSTHSCALLSLLPSCTRKPLCSTRHPVSDGREGAGPAPRSTRAHTQARAECLLRARHGNGHEITQSKVPEPAELTCQSEGQQTNSRTRIHTGSIYPRRCTRGRPGENIAGRAQCCEVEHARPRSGLLLLGSAAGGGICAGLTLTPLVTSPSLLPS